MPAKELNLNVEQGSDWSHGWAVTVNGEPIDNTWTARAQARSVYGVLLHEFAADVLEGGVVVIAVTPAESSAWIWQDGVYDVEVVNNDETLTLRVAEGRIVNSREVTRDA